MTQYVVDASVAVKWFIPEIHSVASLRLLDEEHQLLAPDLLIPELGNILWKKIQLGELEAAVGLEILQALLSAPIELYSSDRVMQAALEVAVATGRTFYDSLYLAGALFFSCRLATADKKLVNGLAHSPYQDAVVFVEEI